MCKFFSAIFDRKYRGYYHPTNDSHEAIIEYHHLNDGATSYYRQNLVRVEFTPPEDKSKAAYLSQWNLQIDEPSVPDWFDRAIARSKLERIVQGMFTSASGMLLDGAWILLDGASVKETKTSRAIPMIGKNCIENDRGDKRWYKNGLKHREDGPAIEWTDGNKLWYQNGLVHREDGPACEWTNGDKEWYKNGQFHRKDGPAVERANGHKAWYENGLFLRYEISLKSLRLK